VDDVLAAPVLEAVRRHVLAARLAAKGRFHRGLQKGFGLRVRGN